MGVCEECDSKGDSGLLEARLERGPLKIGVKVTPGCFWERVNEAFGLLGFARILILEE